ncbi:MAG: hypothetical protein AB1630_09445 [bacterium]
MKWWLTAAVDDATGEILFAKFYPSDGVFSNMEAIRSIVEPKGIFYASLRTKLHISKPQDMEDCM